MLLILDFDVDHILTANRIDDEHSDDEHWFSDESEGILLFSYLYGFIILFVSSCGWLFKCANCNLIFFFNFHLNIAVCIFLLILEMTMYQIIIFLL